MLTIILSICGIIAIIHVILYLFNSEYFYIKSNSKLTNSTSNSNSLTSKNVNSILIDSINELKTLNEDIINGSFNL